MLILREYDSYASLEKNEEKADEVPRRETGIDDRKGMQGYTDRSKVRDVQGTKFMRAVPEPAALLLTALARKPELVVQTGYSRDISSVAFSPGGKLLAGGSDDQIVILWDVAAGKQLSSTQPTRPWRATGGRGPGRR